MTRDEREEVRAGLEDMVRALGPLDALGMLYLDGLPRVPQVGPATRVSFIGGAWRAVVPRAG